MASFSFFLKKDDRGKGRDNSYPIYIRFTHRGAKEFFQTNFRAKEADLIYTVSKDAKKKKMKDGRLKLKPQSPDAINLNIAIDELYAVAIEITNGFKKKLQHTFTAIDIKMAFEKIARPEKHVLNDWKQLFDRFIDAAKVKDNTKKSYRVTKHRIMEYLGASKYSTKGLPLDDKRRRESRVYYEGDRKFSIENITPEFFDDLIDWMLDEKKYQPSYPTDVYTDFRNFLKWVNKSKLAYVNPQCIIYEPGRDLTDPLKPAIFLTKDEFKTLINYEPDAPYLERTKDIFLQLCYTALRTSDRHIDESEISNDIIVKKNTKTEGYSRIPILPELDAILKKYNYKMPEISDVNLNKYIKELLKRAGVNAPVKIVKYPGGVKTETIVPKYMAISTKAGRKTLVSRMISADVHEKKIRSITGHVKPLNLEPYMGVEDKDIDEALKKAFE